MFRVENMKSGVSFKAQVCEILDAAGITVDGSNDQDICVLNDRFYSAIATRGSLGLGESYMAGWWRCDNLLAFFSHLIRSQANQKAFTLRDKIRFLMAWVSNDQTIAKSTRVAEQHYDIDIDLYQRMLGDEMIYTCAYWRNADDLASAQTAKLDIIAAKLDFKPGMRILDIGSGWGGAAKYFAKKYGVQVTGVCNSEQQYQHAISELDSDSKVNFKFSDYRELFGRFDAIYSIGMFEHVGFKNYDTFFAKVNELLAPDGLFLLHTIGHKKTSAKVDPWMDKYIFPGGILPSVELIGKASGEYLAMEDWQNFGLDYKKTLLAWFDNIENAWQDLPDYTPEFRRMWRYYLMIAAAAFGERHNHLWQIVFSKTKKDEAYIGAR